MKKQVNIAAVKENPDNPRFIKDAKFKKLVKSIKGFPEMLEKRPIVVDEDMVVLGGNMRLKACKSAGLFEVWVDIAEGWTEDQKREFIVKDNVGFGEWDWDILANEWDVNLLDEWGLDLPKDIDEIQETNDIDDYGEVEFSDEILLEHNYIVLYFDNPMDWEVAKEVYGLKNVKSKESSIGSQKIGLGRVLNGKNFI
jgi:hypothetical protein